MMPHPAALRAPPDPKRVEVVGGGLEDVDLVTGPLREEPPVHQHLVEELRPARGGRAISGGIMRPAARRSR